MVLYYNFHRKYLHSLQSTERGFFVSNTQLIEDATVATNRAHNRLVLLMCAHALYRTRLVPETNSPKRTTVFEWDPTNIRTAVRSLQPGDMMVMFFNRSFVDIDNLGMDHAWRCQPNLKEVVIHNQYDPEAGTTSQLTIPCRNPKGATVHILSADYFRTFNAASPFAYGQFLTHNAGFAEGQTLMDLSDGIACDFGKIIVLNDENRNGWRSSYELRLEITNVIHTSAARITV